MPMPTGIRGSLKVSKTSQHISNNNFDASTSLERNYIADRKLSTPAMDIFSKEKRHSLGFGGGRPSSPKGSSKTSPKLGPAKPAKLEVKRESPPLVFYGQPSQSSGALLSGQLLLTVDDDEIKLKTLDMVLVAKVTTKKPVSKDCPDCSTKQNELFKWTFLTEPNYFKRGIYTFPFSYLLEGHIPATSHGSLGTIDYILDAKAVTKFSDTITVSRPLTVQRALKPDDDKNAVRWFPPTNITINAVLPSHIHPIGEFPVQVRLSGIVDKSLKDIERRWRVRKMLWRIDEHSKIVSAPCSKHLHKIGGDGKGILHEDIRSLGEDDLKRGWKTDFDTAGGQIECQFNAAVRPDSHPLCDVQSPSGLIATHFFVLELVVSEEQTVGKASNEYATPTGSARVLRMQFKVILTERSGMGISWDEEMPPVYEDVPVSPPGYTKIEDFEGDLGSDEELERMNNEERIRR
ncbi:hypothetical protein MMC28_009876 [Mycoblastus sanguinarius]|nr:hypothetical protein [Mycoblastus sanguinarius]